jgi:CRISPR-associated protein Cas1
MLNEFAYCPRLFFMEWVAGSFMDNDDTVEGRFRHQAVDSARGAAPLPDEDDFRVARAITLSSERLGLIARIDLVEEQDGALRPVDYKRGREAPNESGAWEPEQVQLCAQGLLLRDAGYPCTEGVLYFAETRRRVVVPFTDALIERTLQLVAEARSAAGGDRAPPPLVDSPKCSRCSLVGLCLPDELNFLLQRREAPPRRLIVRDPAVRPLYVIEPGAVVGKEGNRLVVTRRGERLASVRLIDVAQLSVFGQIQVTTAALHALFARDIPVCWFSGGGRFLGMADGLPGKHVELRRRQVTVSESDILGIARAIVRSKIRNCRPSCDATVVAT